MNVIFLLAGALGLYFGAEWLIRGSASLSLRLGISKAVVGLTIVGYGTSMPELIVSLQTSLEGQGDISIGNIVGSNICNIGLILGISIFARPISFCPALGGLDGIMMVIAALVLPILMYTSGLNFLAGFGMISLLGAYTVYTIYKSRRDVDLQEMNEIADPKLPPWKDVAYIFFGLVVLIGSARVFLFGAIGIATYWGVSEAVIGLTVVAVGTSLPELSASVVAALRKHGDIALGNIVGSNIYNILGILGLVGLISPIDRSSIAALDYGVMIAYTLIFYGMLWRGKTVGRKSGALLLGAYGLYAYFLFKP